MPKNYCIMQIWAESGKSALPICNYSQILYQFLTFTQNLKRSQGEAQDLTFTLFFHFARPPFCLPVSFTAVPAGGVYTASFWLLSTSRQFVGKYILT